MAKLPESPDPAISCRPFGSLGDGRQVDAWTLRGRGGMEVEVLTYGAAVRRLELPDEAGGFVDVVLGFDGLAQYESENASYFGVVPGRIAGRLPGGQLRIDREFHQLECNEGVNHLHGGAVGLDKRVWSAAPVDSPEGGSALQLRHTSPDGDQGYPGTVDIRLTYTVTDDNRLIFDSEASSDRTTPLSLPQHSYFNLAGNGSVEDHEVRILASEQMTTDENMTPLGVAEPVAGQAADLRQPQRLGDVIPGLWKQHGALYRLDSREALKHAAWVRHPASGRTLEAWTTHDFLQFYTASHLDGSITGKGGRKYFKHAGLCLECQGYPDPAAGFGDILVRPGETQQHRTIYAFGSDG